MCVCVYACIGEHTVPVLLRWRSLPAESVSIVVRVLSALHIAVPESRARFSNRVSFIYTPDDEKQSVGSVDPARTRLDPLRECPERAARARALWQVRGIR